MRHRPLIPAIALAVVLGLVLAGCGSSSSRASSTGSASAASTTSTTSTGAATAQIGFENVPIEQGADIAPASSTQTGAVDGITCGPTEQLAYHIHAHLLVYVNGQPRALPGGIGIPGSVVEQSSEGPVAAGGQCIYWLHTHAPDGVIHIESPTRRIYTLGNFFDEWHQPLSATQVGTATGTVTAFVNGKAWTKSLRTIPLEPHAVIQLSVGDPVVPFKTFSWSETQL
ncbi:MAG TPA: hypothetical protein VMU39_28185 [Solirubrobacteraceae bacterium]|nr:hypothetical protein [Solirubrobacteraceae bacterium]